MIAIESSDLKAHRQSVSVLAFVNLIPLLGVLFWRWSAFEVVFLYWLENVVIGLFNIAKMIAVNPDRAQISKGQPEAVNSVGSNMIDFGNISQGSKLFMVPFFAFHYLFFCFVHGVFVFVLLGEGNGFFGGGSVDDGTPIIQSLSTMLLAVGALIAGHLYSFTSNYIGKGEFRRTTLDRLMVAPYPRIVALHVAIIFGGWAIMALGSPIFLLTLLVLFKTALEIVLHIRSQKKLEKSDALVTTAR